MFRDKLFVIKRVCVPKSGIKRERVWVCVREREKSRHIALAVIGSKCVNTLVPTQIKEHKRETERERFNL